MRIRFWNLLQWSARTIVCDRAKSAGNQALHHWPRWRDQLLLCRLEELEITFRSWSWKIEWSREMILPEFDTSEWNEIILEFWFTKIGRWIMGENWERTCGTSIRRIFAPQELKLISSGFPGSVSINEELALILAGNLPCFVLVCIVNVGVTVQNCLICTHISEIDDSHWLHNSIFKRNIVKQKQLNTFRSQSVLKHIRSIPSVLGQIYYAYRWRQRWSLGQPRQMCHKDSQVPSVGTTYPEDERWLGLIFGQ